MSILCYSMNLAAAEKSLRGGADINYKYDDNTGVSSQNAISLSGMVFSGYVEAQYATPRFNVVADLELGAERYDDASLDSDNPLLADPDPAAFDSENYDLKLDTSYDWERHRLSLHGRYWRDSTLNTQFTDTGLGGLREIQGATARDTVVLSPAWQWQLSERQSLNSELRWQQVDFENERYTDYDYNVAQFNWTYALSERVHIQVVPSFSQFENKAEFTVASDTLGLQGGFVWDITEKWKWNLLVGGTRVYTEYAREGYYIFNPETGQIEFIEIKDQDTSGFSGSSIIGFTDEFHGFSFHLSSRVTPSGDGFLRQTDEGRVTYFWKPAERVRLNVDGRVGQSDSTDDRVTNAREYGEVAIRLGYQFANNWWVSGRYRYREQKYKQSGRGSGEGNLVTLNLSYRLPEEIL